MKRIIRAINASILLIVALMFPILGGYSAFAEKSDYRLQVSPPTLDIELEPGKTSTGSFEVVNSGLKEYSFAIGVGPYSVKNSNYEPDYDTDTVYNDIVEWISFSQTEGTVAPDDKVEITFTVDVPNDVPYGGQYATIYVEMVNPLSDTDNSDSNNSNIGVNQKIGIILYSEVEGETREEGAILENRIPSILFNPPVIATSLVENTGNVHAKATYVLQVYPLFGDEEVYTNEENPTELYVLPETQRFNSISWDGAPQLGIFRVKQTVSILDDTETIEKIVFLCPIWFLFLILLILFFVIFWLFSRIRSRRRPAARASHRSSTPAAHHEPKSSTDSEHPQEPQD